MVKISLALLSAAVAVSAAQPHGHHQHQRIHKARNADAAVVVSPQTEVVYVLNGKTISESEVQQGIKNGSLVFANDGELTSKAPSKYTAPPAYVAPSSSSSSTSTTKTKESKPTPATDNPVSSAAAAVQSAAASVIPSYGGGSSGSGSWGDDATGVEEDFPDGEIDCSTFPSEYGAVPVEWTGLGGWTGVQKPGSSDAGGYANIMTVSSGGSCTEGAYCSYACPPGYQKSQWPTTQGSTGQSVGGLKCSGGKLHLTNPSMCAKLCMKGSEKVQIKVQNKMTKNVAVCRTDYPGTESETVPVDVPAEGQSNLTCPDADNYYTWQGGKTSAQYYVNPAGVSVEKACQWGDSSNPWGNFAPLNLGVGYSNDAAWLSIMQNSPTTDAKLDFCVEIIGDGISGTCKYSNGQYCGGANYDDCSSTTGCTVSLSSGTATFVFSDSS